MTAQRGDFVSPPASSPTDRRDADDAAFAAELARLDRLEVADEDTVERVARAMYDSDQGWENDAAWIDGAAHAYRRLARAAIAALKPAPGTECRHVGKRGLDCDCDEPASGTDSSGQEWRWHREPGTGDEWERVWNCCDGPYDEAPAGHYADCPGTDTPGQAVQRVLALADDLDSHVKPRSFHPAGTHSDGASHAYADAAARIRAAVAGPQRDHEARAREVLLPEVFAAERDRFAAPGTDSSGQAVQLLLALADEWESSYPDPDDDYDVGRSAGLEYAAEQLRDAVAGPESSR